MKKLIICFCVAITVIACTAPKSFERLLIEEICNDYVEDSCIVLLPGDTTSTAFVKAAFAENGVYLISDLPLSNPRFRADIKDGLRTLYVSEFTYMGEKENLYVYGLSYCNFPSMSRYHFDLMDYCTLQYYNGEGIRWNWEQTYYTKDNELFNLEEFPELSFEKWFHKAIPYILN